MQQQENVWVNWETVYVQLAHCYLYHFLPRDSSSVLPIISPYIRKTPQRKLVQSPESKRYFWNIIKDILRRDESIKLHIFKIRQVNFQSEIITECKHHDY